MTTTAQSINYNNITLRLFMQVAETGDVSLLGMETAEQCEESWQQIIEQHAQVNGKRFNHIDNDRKVLKQLLIEYNFVKACLIKSLFHVDKDIMEVLRNKGYKLSLVGATIQERSLAYAESLTACLRRVDTFIDRIKKQQEKIMSEIKENETHKISFDSVMAELVIALGFQVSDDITLVRFNSYWEIIRRRAAASK